MTEFSGMWTTDASTPVGDQQTSYTQAQLSTAFSILAGCARYQGISASYKNEIESTDGGVNSVDVDTGGAMVDGKYYDNTASVAVTIPSAVGGGNTRIDRIVLRADWAGFTVRIYRIAGTDAASPSAPAITQTSGSTYDITLCQVLVDTSGNVTVTDERAWATAPKDDVTIAGNSDGDLEVKDLGITAAKIATAAVGELQLASNSVNSAELITGSVDLVHMSANSIDSNQYVDGSIDQIHLADNIVDDDKVGNRVPALANRQGGSATAWSTSGATNRTPTTVRMQVGQFNWSGSAATQGSAVVTFPTAFSYAPLVFVSSPDNANQWRMNVTISTIGASSFVIVWYNVEGADTVTSLDFMWLAIGQE